MKRATTPFLAATHWGTYYAQLEAEANVSTSPASGDGISIAHGSLSPSAFNAVPRITQPMIRKGYLLNRRNSDTTQRGSDAFYAVSWGEAFDLAAEALAAARDNLGSGSILGGASVKASPGHFHHPQNQIQRFLHGFGGASHSVEGNSYTVAEVLLPHVLGMSARQAAIDAPTTVEVAQHCKRVVYFGGAMASDSQTNPVDAGSHNPLAHYSALGDAGIDVINISSIRDSVNPRARPHWLPCRPDSEVAIMLAMVYTLIEEDLYDKAFVNRCCVGFEVFAAYVMGKADGVAKNASWAEKISEIPAQETVTLARLMAADRCLIEISFAIERAEHAEQSYWTAIALAAALGYIGLPGGGIAIRGTGAMGPAKRRVASFPVGSLPPGWSAALDFVPFNRATDMLEFPGARLACNGKDFIYPAVDLMYWVGGNPLDHHQDVNRFRRAWNSPKTIITHQANWTTTARFSDIVFPCTSPLEREDFIGGDSENRLAPVRRALDPFLGARDDYSIFSALSRRLGFVEQFTESRSANHWVKHLYNITQNNAAAEGVTLPEFEVFRDGPPIELERLLKDGDQVLARFRDDADKYPLNTPSGKIEIFSQTIASFGYVDCAGHPAWHEKREWLGSALVQTYPFHLLSNQPGWHVRGQFGQASTTLAPQSRASRGTLRMNTEDARVRGIRDGDIIKVFNVRGSFLAVAGLSNDVRQSVIQISADDWEGMLDGIDATGMGFHGNPNAVTSDIGTSSLAQGSSTNSCLVDIEKHQGPPPRLAGFALPEIIKKDSSRGPRLVSER